MEELGRRPLVIADGAHNGDSARRLREALLKYFEFRKAVLVVGVSADKNVEEIASELLPLASTVILTKSRHMRAADPADIADAFTRPDIIVETTGSVKEALGKGQGDSLRGGPDLCHGLAVRGGRGDRGGETGAGGDLLNEAL